MTAQPHAELVVCPPPSPPACETNDRWRTHAGAVPTCNIHRRLRARLSGNPNTNPLYTPPAIAAKFRTGVVHQIYLNPTESRPPDTGSNYLIGARISVAALVGWVNSEWVRVLVSTPQALPFRRACKGRGLQPIGVNLGLPCLHYSSCTALEGACSPGNLVAGEHAVHAQLFPAQQRMATADGRGGAGGDRAAAAHHIAFTATACARWSAATLCRSQLARFPVSDQELKQRFLRANKPQHPCSFADGHPGFKDSGSPTDS